MKVLVSGSSGLIGSALLPVLTAAGHQTTRLVRKQGTAGVFWNPDEDVIDAAALEGFDAVVHLAGESIAARRWTPMQKAKITDSRVKGTRLLAGALAKLQRRPAVFVSASAIGYYGDRGDEVLTEESASGRGFLPEVCRLWESAASAAAPDIRIVHPRTGIVLAKNGGALPRMALPFRMGVGGRIGSGRQYMSWIALDDLTRIILYCIENPTIRGAVNAVAPSPVTNAEFTKVLGRVLSRPALFPLPAFAARLALGEMANELLLASNRVVPSKLLAAGFTYRHTDLEEALRSTLKP